MSLRDKIKHNNRMIIKRIKSEEPHFFKVVIRVCLWFSGLAGSLLALIPTLSLEVSPIIKQILEYGLIAGTVAASVAKLTSVQEEKLEQEYVEGMHEIEEHEKTQI